MSAVRIADVEVGPASDGPVVQALMTLDRLPVRPRQWCDVAVALARALEPRRSLVEGVYAVFDISSSAGVTLEFGKVLQLYEADVDALRRLGAGTTVAYAAVRRGKGGEKGGEKEPVLAVTIQTAPAVLGGVGVLGRRLRLRHGRSSVVAVVGEDGEVRHLEMSRRPKGGGSAAELAEAYSRG
jgi:hypothetical protein